MHVKSLEHDSLKTIFTLNVYIKLENIDIRQICVGVKIAYKDCLMFLINLKVCISYMNYFSILKHVPQVCQIIFPLAVIV